jgi:hypothetical protein
VETRMNIKGLLISSAAAVVAVSGAQAADAIVIAEPEPMEYVRICDTYGTGYFYIPGTETCLKIGGYLRYQMQYEGGDELLDASGAVFAGDYRFGKYARFAPHFTAKSATEWGVLTSHAEVHFNWQSADFIGLSSVNLEHAYISLDNGTGSFLVGKTDTPFYDFLGYWAGPTIYEGHYGGGNLGQVRYTHDFGNGFSIVGAVVENNGNTDFEPSLEAGAKFEQDWGWVAGAVAYDNVEDEFGARAGIGFNFTPAISMSLHGLYNGDSAGISMYSLNDGYWNGNGNVAEWSVLVGATAAVSEKLSLNGHFQWFDTDEWNGAVNAAWTPVNGLTITPEVAYISSSETTIGYLRFQRNF